MFVIWIIFGETEFALNCWKMGLFFGQHFVNKSSWIIWVVLKRTVVV